MLTDVIVNKNRKYNASTQARDFLYGIDGLSSVRIIDSGAKTFWVIDVLDAIVIKFFRAPVLLHKAAYKLINYRFGKACFCFVDSWSFAIIILLGLGVLKGKTKFFLGFHKFEDVVGRSYLFRRIFVSLLHRIPNSRLRIFFFGARDSSYFKKIIYNPIAYDVFPFGVDIEFWSSPQAGCPPRPLKSLLSEPYFLAVGSDPNRDFSLLSDVKWPARCVVVSSLVIKGNNPAITQISGDIENKHITDIDLRLLYQNAKAIVLPIKSVAQPVGLSVCYQALASGTRVLMSDFPGWFVPSHWGAVTRLPSIADEAFLQVLERELNGLLFAEPVIVGYTGKDFPMGIDNMIEFICSCLQDVESHSEVTY